MRVIAAPKHEGGGMQDLNSRDALLETVRSLRDEVEQIASQAGDGMQSHPGDFEDWTVKDTIAHLTSWRLTTVARLEASLHGGEPVFPWPAHLDEDTQTSEINRWFFEANRDKPLAEVTRESRETFERVERAIAALPEQDLLERSRFAWMGDYPLGLGPAVVQGTYEHHHEHVPDLQAKLR